MAQVPVGEFTPVQDWVRFLVHVSEKRELTPIGEGQAYARRIRP